MYIVVMLRRPLCSLAVLTLLSVSALVGVSTPALAVTVDGKWGVGFEETLTGIADPTDDDTALVAIPASGLAIHKYIGDIDLEAIVGARARIALNGPTDWRTFLSLGVHYFAFRAPRANLSAGARIIGGMHRPIDIGTQTSRPLSWGFTFEVPLRAMFFLSDHFAISGSVGLVAALERQSSDPDVVAGNPLTGGSDAVKVNLFKGGFSGGLGFTFFLD